MSAADRSTSDRTLVVGLGNPGPTYVGTRHNIGAMVVEVLADRLGSRFRSHKAGADVAEGRLRAAAGSVSPASPGMTSNLGHPVAVAIPRSFMNVSGKPVAGLVRFYRIDADALVVVHDELDLPFGTVRVKQGGGEGGHNGLRSVSSAIGTKDYLRVRIGIGRPPGRMNPADYVLRGFSPAERKEIDLVVELAADAVEMLVNEGLTATQNKLHQPQP